MSLRPECTASVMRSFVENHLHNLPGTHKFFYLGPMFRYERPQSGRYRQFHQFGVEALGVKNPEQDVEMIDMLCEIYRRLGLKGLTVMVNSVGDEASRAPFREALKNHLRPNFDKLSADSQVRFEKNVLRILDSKDPEDQKLLEGGPSILDMLTEECKEHFAKVCHLLKKEKIPFVVTPKMVRGLDYYNKTVFEVTSGQLGAHNTIGAGGRYDGLVGAIGGPDLPGVGYATGIERILQTMVKQNAPFPTPPHPRLFLIGLGEAAREYCFDLLCKLRHENIPAEMDLQGKKVQHGMQLANTLRAEYVLVIGDSELSSQKAELKQMSTRESRQIDLADLIKSLGDNSCKS